MRIDQIPDPVQRERQLDYNRAIAQKIRNRLQQLENANEKDKRRWVWELLQNAKDTVTDRKVDIEIIANENFLEFKHNGGFFSPRNITNLIHQISSKEGVEGNIGRFGTGFLTTHTLSRLVEVEGVFYENDEYYNFELKLDRRSSTEKDLVIGIENSWESFKSTKIDKPQNEIWTIFRYINPDIDVANTTLKDFKTFIHFNLAFVQGIGIITINNEIEDYQTSFELIETPDEIEKGISVFSFLKDNKQIDLLYAENENVNIAIEIKEIEGRYSFLPLAKNIPRIFCAFPLIGTENFYFPFVVNSNGFIPKTERDKLYLKGETKDADKNKELLIYAVDLYEKVVQFASQNKWKDFFVIADTKLPKEDDDLDRNWYQKNIQKRIRDFLLTIPIVETEKNELVAISDNKKNASCYFPYHTNSETREIIWKFTYDLFPENVPCKANIHNWYNVLWNECYYQTIDILAEEDIQNSENIEKLNKKLNLEITEAYKWLNNLLLFFEQEKKEIFEEYKVLPNQYGEFKLKKELYEDKNIPNELKEIYKDIGVCRQDILKDAKTDWKKELLHSSIKIEMSSFRTVYGLSEAINAIVRRCNFDFSNQEFTNIIYRLISLSHKEISAQHKKIWEFSRVLYFDAILERIKILDNTEAFSWIDSLEWQINKVVFDISKLKYVEILETELHGNIEAIDWLSQVIEFIRVNEPFSYLLDSEKHPILPNQNGTFYPKANLFHDSGDIDEELKEVLRFFNNEWLDELLDKKIYLELPENRTRHFEDIASEIDRAFRNYHDSKQEPGFIKAYRTLFAWFKSQDEENIKIHFDWIYRHKAELALGILGDDEEKDSIFEIIQQGNAPLLSKIAKNKLISNDDLIAFAENPEEFKRYREFIEKGDEAFSKQDVIEEINRELGQNFQSIDELIETFKPRKRRFKVDHRNINWEAIEQSNEQAKDRIKEHLRNEGYEVNNWVEEEKTIISGVVKDGIPIKIVAKSADMGNIILDKAGKEKKVLKDSFTELWVHSNGRVFQITLGEFIEEWDIEYIEASKFDFH